MMMSISQKINYFLIRTGLITLFFMFWMIFVSTSFLILGKNISGYYFFISLVLSMITSYMLLKPSRKYLYEIIGVVLFVLLLFFLIKIYSLVFCLDWDGNNYHKVAVGLLKNGWNPCKESSSVYNKYILSDVNDKVGLWCDHYGKSTWIISAVIYALFGNIECGKIYQILGIYCAFAFAFSYMFEKRCDLLKSVIFGLVLAFNPISIVQIVSYYVDGFVFSMCYVLLIGLMQLINEKNISKYTLAIIFSSMSILSNVKFTGLVLGGLLCIFYYLLFCFFDYQEKNTNKIKLLVYFVILAVFSVGIIGFPTYVKNFIDHGNMFYPLMGSNINIMSYSEPIGFANKSSLFKFFFATFGRLENFNASNQINLPTLKIPFIVWSEELKLIPPVDTRISGFGLFFSGLLLLSTFLIIKYLKCEEDTNKNKLIVLTGLVYSIGLIIFFSEGWWARYSPHIYLVVILAVFLILDEKIKIKRSITIVLLVLLIQNNFYFMMRPVDSINKSKVIQNELTSLDGKKIEIKYDGFMGKLFNFEDFNIEYEVAEYEFEHEGSAYGCSWRYLSK